LKREDSTIGLVYNNERSVAKYRVELEFMFDSMIAAGKFAYEKQLVNLAAEMRIKRWDKHDF
jgi:hypothetical protein